MDKLDLEIIKAKLEADRLCDCPDCNDKRWMVQEIERLRAALPVEEKGPRPVDLACPLCRTAPEGRDEIHWRCLNSDCPMMNTWFTEAQWRKLAAYRPQEEGKAVDRG